MDFRCWDFFFLSFSHGEYQFNKYLFKDIDWDVNLNELFVIQSQHKLTPHTQKNFHSHALSNEWRQKQDQKSYPPKVKK